MEAVTDLVDYLRDKLEHADDVVWTAPTESTPCTCNPEGPRREDRQPSGLFWMIDHLCPWHGDVAADRYKRRRAELERQRAEYFR